MNRIDFEMSNINEIKNISYKKIANELSHTLWYSTYHKTDALFESLIYINCFNIKVEIDCLL